MLKCTKFDFGWGSAPDPAGGAYSAPPDPLAGFKGPTSKGKGGEGRGRKRRGGKGRGRNVEGRGERKREGRGIRTPLRIGLITGLLVSWTCYFHPLLPIMFHP